MRSRRRSGKISISEGRTCSPKYKEMHSAIPRTEIMISNRQGISLESKNEIYILHGVLETQSFHRRLTTCPLPRLLQIFPLELVLSQRLLILHSLQSSVYPRAPDALPTKLSPLRSQKKGSGSTRDLGYSLSDTSRRCHSAPDALWVSAYRSSEPLRLSDQGPRSRFNPLHSMPL